MAKPCGDIQNWDWESGDLYEDKTVTNLKTIDGTEIPIVRNYFDCGEYFFDGTFNVVRFKKGMILYHGSGLLADNLVSFPVGIDYYRPSNDPDATKINADMNQFTTFAISSKDSIQDIISEYFPITAGWYADPSVAKLYSEQYNPDIPNANIISQNCGGNCIFAYKLTRDVVMFLLDDDYNIYKLLSSANNIVEDGVKQSLADMFDIKELPERRYNENPFQRLRFQKRRKSSRDIDNDFANFFCGNSILKSKYGGYCATSQYSAYHGGQFHIEFIFCNAFKYLTRDYTNKWDWQSEKVQLPQDKKDIDVFIDQLKLYKTTNINFHAGNLYEHSIWSLLWTEHLLNDIPNFKGWFNTETDKRLVTFTSFIHDIGKVVLPPESFNIERGTIVYYSIPDHPQYGADIILGTRQFPVYNTNPLSPQPLGYLSVNNLFQQFGFEYNHINKYLIALVILLHWEYGDMVIKPYNKNKANIPQNQQKDYIYNLIKVFVDKCKSYFSGITLTTKQEQAGWFIIFMKILLIVSIADILAMQPYGKNRLTSPLTPGHNLNVQSRYFNFISNKSKLYRGINLSDSATDGIFIANIIINNINIFL